jgi:hypothetical protein
MQLGLFPDDKGNYTMYKSVSADLRDFYSGNYQYVIGGSDKITMERNQKIECGEGFHFSSIWNAIAFAQGREYVIISATVNIDDIMSVYDKCRVRAYKDVRIVNVNFAGQEVTKR